MTLGLLSAGGWGVTTLAVETGAWSVSGLILFGSFLGESTRSTDQTKIVRTSFMNILRPQIPQTFEIQSFYYLKF